MSKFQEHLLALGIGTALAAFAFWLIFFAR